MIEQPVDPLRVAILGAGDMGGQHAAAWRSLGHRLVVVADSDGERAARLAREHGIERTARDYREAASAPDVDVAVIAMPLPFHASATVLAAEQGKHVLVEKPLCRTWQEAERMERAVEAAGTVFGVGFQRNLAEGVGLLREWVARGRFGHPLLFSSDLLQPVRPKLAMHERSGNGGPLTDAGCHYYLLWQTVFRAKPQTVHARGRILAGRHPETARLDQLAIDTAVVTIEYQSGDLGTFTVSWGLPPEAKLRGRSDRIIGPLGAAEGEVNSGLDVYDGDRQTRVDLERRDLVRVEAERFAAAVRGGDPFPSGFPTGREMLAVTQAIFEAIDSGRPARVREA